VSDMRAKEKEVAALLRPTTGDTGDACLVGGLPLLQLLYRVPTAAPVLIDRLVAAVAHENQVLERLQSLLVDATIATRAGGAERVDVRLFGEIDVLLCDGRLPQWAVAAVELTAARGDAPQHRLNRTADVPRLHLRRVFGRHQRHQPSVLCCHRASITVATERAT